MTEEAASPDLQMKWLGDLLDRKSTADFLTKYVVKSHAQSSAVGNETGLVIALDAGWGAGKSFFIDRWTEDLKANHPVVSFDAWKNDFTPDPLLGFLAELRKDIQPHLAKIPAAKKAWQSVLKQARLAIKPVMTIATGAALRAGTGLSLELIKEAFASDSSAEQENASSGVESKKALESKQLDKIFEELLKTHEDRKSAISGFREALQDLVEQIGRDPNLHLPMFVMIDELDRCRPTYAIELLEGIKHLFGVPGVCFVVATNLDQLAESAKAIYGGGFDANQYLKKFFDLHYQLPPPNERAFIKQLLVENGLDTDSRLQSCLESHYYTNADKIVELFCLQSKMFELTLRDQQQVMRVIQATVISIDASSIYCPYLFFLAMLRHRSAASYDHWMATTPDKSRSIYEEIVKTRVRVPAYVLSRSQVARGGDQSPKRTAISEIVWLFHKTSQKNLISVREDDSGVNSYDYPDSLLNLIAAEAPNSYTPGKHYPSSLSKYSGLVRHAGQIVAGTT